MLKLEMHPRLGSVDVILRHQDYLLTPRFLFALCVALLIHLIGFIVFQIKPYFVRDAARVYPPVEIFIDFETVKEGGIETQISNERKPSYTFELPSLTPIFSPLPIIETKDLLYYQNIPLKKDSFAQLIEQLVDDEFLRLDKTNPTSHPIHPIDIRISGNLSRLKIIDKGWREKDFPGIGFGKKAKSYHLSYEVKVDDRTGCIFWQQPLNALKKTHLGAYANELLKQMYFEEDSNGFITDGQIEIIFYCYD
jgi:hypothetical protein